MFSYMLLTVSIAAFAQFGLFYWRAVIAGVAAQPVSDRVLRCAGLGDGRVTARDFSALAGLHDLTPDLENSGGLGLVKLYYHIIGALGSFAGSRLPALASWAEREGGICARYTAVVVDRRLQSNLAFATSLRNY
jgi:hypothetical protein